MIGTTVSHYHITAHLGEGGMGVVYRAEDLKLDRTVALKFLAPEFVRDSEAKARFVHEAKAASALDHPNICTIHGIETTPDGRLFIAMACYEGETLENRIARGPLGLEESVELVVQAAQGLAKAHDLGMVHRDIKPANLFLTDDGLVKLLDFGIAKLAGQTQITRPGATIGTMKYMSPEQLQGEAVDRRTDLWSLGVVLYEMLAGKAPFTGESAQATASAILHAEPAPLREQRRDVPTTLELCVARCLRKAASERYQAAEELLQVLQPLIHRGDTRWMGERTAPRHGLTDARGLQPYPGLASFSESDAEYFHGREAQVEAVWRKLRNHRLVGVTGPSGVGKTSFLRAGLIPAKPKNWGVVIATPGGSPFLSLREALVRELAGDTQAMLTLLRENDPDTDVTMARRWRVRHDEALLVLDQFEELFTLTPSAEQTRFAELLSRLVLEADVHVLVAMRDDFLYRCHEHAGLAPVVDALILLSPLTGPTLRRALMQPALECGYRFEDETLVDEMMAAVEGERGALPLLAFAMARLWDRRDRDRGLLTRAAHAEVGDAGGALAQHAESMMEKIGVERHDLVRELLLNLVTSQGTRAVQDRDELLSVFGVAARPAAAEVLDQMISARLLTSYEVMGEDGTAHHRVEIVHESLLSAWPRLVRWQTQDADSAQLRDQLRQAAYLWEQKGRSDDLLWTGTALQEFQLWRERDPGGLSATEDSFAQAMMRRATRTRRRRRLAYAGTMVALLAIVAVVSVFWWQAVGESRRAEAQKLLALGRMRLEVSPTETLAYATKSLELADGHEARRLVVDALAAGPPATLFEMGEPSTSDRVAGVEFSRDGAWAAMIGFQRIQIVSRDATIRHALEPFPETGPGLQARFDFEGKHLYASRHQELRVWSIPDFTLLTRQTLPEGRTLLMGTRAGFFGLTYQTEDREVLVVTEYGPDHEPRQVARIDRPQTLAIDRENGWFAYSEENALFVRSLAAWNEPPRQIGVHPQRVVDIVFEPSGNILRATDEAGEMRTWSVAGEGNPVGVVAHWSGPRVLPSGLLDGNRLVELTPAPQMSVAVWDFDAPAAAVPWRFSPSLSIGPANMFLSGATFVPGSPWLATAHVNALAFWPLTRHQPWVLGGADDIQLGLEFTPDGDGLVGLLWGRAGVEVVVWDLRAGGSRRTLGSVITNGFPTLVVDPRGRFVAVTVRGGIDLVSFTGQPTTHLEGYALETLIGGVAIDADGRRVAACSGVGAASDKVIRIWDLETGDVTVLGPHEFAGDGFDGQTWGVAFLPDHRLVSCGFGGIRVWNLEDNTSEVMAPGNEQSNVAVFGDGRYVASWRGTLTEGTRLQITDLATGTSRDLPAREGGRVVVDRAGTFLVGADVGEDGTIQVVPIVGGEPHLLLGHERGAWALAVSPDGRRIATAGRYDGTIRIWPVPDLSQPPLQALAHDELLARLRKLTNVRLVKDDEAPSGWELEAERFRGWETAPVW